ncbi:MAG TPA: MFS transporter [Candidatus Mediterraneibacter intestinavium]|nr:MFS transporter [Candidatus Mediterraneibacter intestinavium]
MSELTGVQLVEREKFSGKKMLGYACYKGSATLNGLLVSYVTYYATDSLFLSAAAIGMVLAFSRVFDGFTDIMAGIMIDRTNTKIGRGRPYILCGILAYIAMAAMFCTPNLPDVGKLIWIFITYNLNSSIFQTLCAIADATILKRIIVKSDNRVRTLSYTGFFVNIASTAVNVLLPLIVAKTAGDARYWSYLGIGLGAVGIAMLVIAFVCCKEYTPEELVRFGVLKEADAENQKKTTLKEMALGIIKNKYFLIYLFVFFVNAFYLGISYSVQVYYYSANLGDVALMSTVSLITIVTWPLNLVYPKIIRRTGSAAFAKYMLVVGAVGSILRMFVGANVIGLVVTGFLSGWVIAGINLIGSEITIQCMDYSYLKNGLRVESIYNSFLNFAMKVGMGVGSAVLGIMLGWFGYDGSLAVQPDSALSAINFFFNIFPAICAALMFVGLQFCKVEEANKKLRGEISEAD